MKKREQKRTWKKLTILLAFIIIFSGIICLTWYIFVHLPYVGYTKDFQFTVTDMGVEQYIKDTDDYTCKVHTPEFLSWSGFLVIEKGSFSVKVLRDGSYVYPNEPNIMLFIWPSVFGKPEYGLMIEYEKMNIMAQTKIKFEKNNEGSYNIVHNLEEPDVLKLYDEYKPEFDKMLDCAEKTWSFEGIQDVSNGWKANK